MPWITTNPITQIKVSNQHMHFINNSFLALFISSYSDLSSIYLQMQNKCSEIVCHSWLEESSSWGCTKLNISDYGFIPFQYSYQTYCLFLCPPLVTGLLLKFLLGDCSENWALSCPKTKEVTINSEVCNTSQDSLTTKTHSQVLFNFTCLICGEQKERSEVVA